MVQDDQNEAGRAEKLRNAADTLEAASRDLAALVPALERLVTAESMRAIARDHRAEITAPMVRAVIAQRRLRGELLGVAAGDTGWALLAEAFARHLEGRRLTMAALAAATGVAATTTLRWTDRLVEAGFSDASPTRPTIASFVSPSPTRRPTGSGPICPRR